MKTKRTRAIVMAILIQSTAIGTVIFGQNATEETWTRIETDKKEVSATFPMDYIVDSKKRWNGQTVRIIGFKKGMLVELKVIQDGDPKGRLNRIDVPDSETSKVFKMGDLSLRRFVSAKTQPRYFQKIYAASNSRLFILNVDAAIGDQPEVLRFLGLIKFSGEQLFQPLEKYAALEKQVSISSLESSPVVTELLARKVEKYAGKIDYRSESQFVRPPAAKVDIRPVICFDIPNPTIPRALAMTGSKMSCRVMVNHLSTGQVGDITVYSESGKDFSRACADAAQKIKFLPAWDGDKNIDFVDVHYFEVRTAIVTTTLIQVSPTTRRVP